MKISTLTAFAVFSALGASLAHSAVINDIDVSSPGYHIRSGNTQTRTFGKNLIIGDLGGTVNSAAMNFLLPDLEGQPIEAVQLETYYQGSSNFGYNAAAANTSLAVFAKISNTSTRTSADFIAPAANDFSTTPSGWTEIQLDFIPAGFTSESNTLLTLSATGRANLETFVSNYYAGTPSGGDYLVLGYGLDLNGETLSSTVSRNLLLTGDGTVDGTVSDVTITVVPEPSAIALVALGAGFVMFRRRRK